MRTAQRKRTRGTRTTHAQLFEGSDPPRRTNTRSAVVGRAFRLPSPSLPFCAAHLFPRSAKITLDSEQIWLEPKSGHELLERFIGLTSAEKNKAEIIVCFSIVGIESKRFRELLGCFHEVAASRQLNAEIDANPRIVRAEPDRFI